MGHSYPTLRASARIPPQAPDPASHADSSVSPGPCACGAGSASGPWCWRSCAPGAASGRGKARTGLADTPPSAAPGDGRSQSVTTATEKDRADTPPSAAPGDGRPVSGHSDRKGEGRHAPICGTWGRVATVLRHLGTGGHSQWRQRQTGRGQTLRHLTRGCRAGPGQRGRLAVSGDNRRVVTGRCRHEDTNKLVARFVISQIVHRSQNDDGCGKAAVKSAAAI